MNIDVPASVGAPPLTYNFQVLYKMCPKEVLWLKCCQLTIRKLELKKPLNTSQQNQKQAKYTLLHKLACNIASYCMNGRGIFTSCR